MIGGKDKANQTTAIHTIATRTWASPAEESQPARHLAFTSVAAVEEVVAVAAAWVRFYEKSASTSLAPKDPSVPG
jgi:hypothetical protein